MFFDNPNWFIFYGGLGLILLELALGVDTGFDFLLIGLSLILGSLAGFLFNSYLFALGFAILLSFLYIVFGRKYVKEKLHIASGKTNIDAVIGKEAIVLKAISGAKAGQVKVENEIWRAIGARDFKVGKKVKIISVEGVTLKVA